MVRGICVSIVCIVALLLVGLPSEYAQEATPTIPWPPGEDTLTPPPTNTQEAPLVPTLTPVGTLPFSLEGLPDMVVQDGQGYSRTRVVHYYVALGPGGRAQIILYYENGTRETFDCTVNTSYVQFWRTPPPTLTPSATPTLIQ